MKKRIKEKIDSETNEGVKNDLDIQLKIIELQKSRVKHVNESLDINKCNKIIHLVGEPVLSESLNQLLTEVKNLDK